MRVGEYSCFGRLQLFFRLGSCMLLPKQSGRFVGNKMILATDGPAIELMKHTICHKATKLATEGDAGVLSLNARVTPMKMDIPGFRYDNLTLPSTPLSDSHIRISVLRSSRRFLREVSTDVCRKRDLRIPPTAHLHDRLSCAPFSPAKNSYTGNTAIASNRSILHCGGHDLMIFGGCF